MIRLLPAPTHAHATPYQSAVLLIWIWNSVESRCAGITVSRWVYKVFQSTVFVLTRSTVVHGATHAAPMGNVVFRWFYKDPLAELPVPSWGIRQQDCFLGDATLRVLLVSPMFFDDFWATVFGFGGGVLLAQQKTLVS